MAQAPDARIHEIIVLVLIPRVVDDDGGDKAGKRTHSNNPRVRSKPRREEKADQKGRHGLQAHAVLHGRKVGERTIVGERNDQAERHDREGDHLAHKRDTCVRSVLHRRVHNLRHDHVRGGDQQRVGGRDDGSDGAHKDQQTCHVAKAARAHQFGNDASERVRGLLALEQIHAQRAREDTDKHGQPRRERDHEVRKLHRLKFARGVGALLEVRQRGERDPLQRETPHCHLVLR
mmetsp:Transcript_17771/g.37564  ORF Transcript_17771/g.37564 Transcript_17771/m.37564 type:complete len:233 (-) Transcript_17771:855-1553(-)